MTDQKEAGEGSGFKRWTAKRKKELVLEILQGRTTVSAAARKFDLKPSQVEQWVDDASKAMEKALTGRPKDDKAEHEAEVKDLRAKVGELVLKVDALEKLKALRDSDENK